MTLTALEIRNAKPGDRLTDGGGLRLDVDKNGKASWIFRYKSPVTGRERYMGLGPLGDVTAGKAREAAQAARAVLREGRDPIEDRNAKRTEAKVEAAKAITFQTFAEQYITTHLPGWKNPKHRQQWSNTLKTYAFPVIGTKPVSAITVEDVVKVLSPIWLAKRETAARVRGRIEQILNAATAREFRVGPNPAVLAIIKHLLPAQKRKQQVKHHPALPYEAMPQFWKSLASETGDAAKMLRFLILTAARYGEVRLMIPEIEIKDKIWTIPAGRMKADREHYVPLPPAALEQLPFQPVSDVTLSKLIRRHTDIPATTHGMRSTFRDWCGDETEAAWEIAEAAIAHAIGNETEAAYRRRTALAKRRKLMEQWATYCSGG